MCNNQVISFYLYYLKINNILYANIQIYRTMFKFQLILIVALFYNCNTMSSSVHKIMLPLSPTFRDFAIFSHSGSHWCLLTKSVKILGEVPTLSFLHLSLIKTCLTHLWGKKITTQFNPHAMQIWIIILIIDCLYNCIRGLVR